MNIKRMVNELIDALNWCNDGDFVIECLDHLDNGLKFSEEEVERDDE